MARYTDPKFPTHADPVLAVRPLHPAERTCSDETLDTILVEHADRRRARTTLRPACRFQQRHCVDLVSRSDPDHHPPARDRHQRPDRPADHLVQIFAGTEEQIISRYRHGQQRQRLEREDLADTTAPLHVRPPNA